MQANSILLVDDAMDVQLVVEAALAGAPIWLSKATNAAQGLDLAKKNRFDLILLDIGLPDQTGYELFLELKKNPNSKNVPVIFLTGKAEVADKVMAFSLGAEDYIVKPFHPIEFRARVESKLRKSKDEETKKHTHRVHHFIFDLGIQRAFKSTGGEAASQKDLGLTPLEYKLFFHLAKNPGRIFSRDQLLNKIWGSEVHVYDRTVDAHICTLRRKLDDDSLCIESVPGIGYRFSIPKQQ